MKRIKEITILILALCSFVEAYSQTKTTIRGKVIDQKDRSAIIGATIIESDNENRVISGTITDVDGNFVYKMKDPSNTMKVSVIGYQTKTFKADLQNSVVFELVSSNIELDEVQIIAKAKSNDQLTNIAERDIASSRVKIDLFDMKDEGITSAADAMQGKVSGLDIISNSGDPGSGSSIVVRGLSSMGNNKPLIVIDGIPQERVSSSFDLSSADTEDISNMINIALQDIKSIEILKDAASTAIYGSKGADGVLLIETNRGIMGKVQFDYQYKNTLNFQPPAIPMLNGDEYVMLQLEEWHNSKGIYDIPPQIAYDKDYVDFYNYSANTDWLREITQTGITHDNYFKISGGGEKTRYYTSLSYVDEGGTTINTGAKQFSTRINLDYFLSRKLMFSVQFSYVNMNIKNNLDISGHNVRSMAYIKAPNMSIWEYDAFGNLTGEYFNPIDSYQGSGASYFNPVAVANLSKNIRSQNSLENSFRLRYSILNWLVFRETISFQYSGLKANQFLPYNAVGSDWLSGLVNSATENNSLSSSIKTESQFAFDIPIKYENHEISGAATWITNQGNSESMYLQSSKTPSTNIQDPSIGGQISYASSGLSQNRDLGALLNMNYKFKDRYMIQTIIRADANSAFGANNRWGVFKGVAAAWRFSSEPWLLRYSNWLSESKFRVSWGVSGRPPSNPYARFATYQTTGTGSYITNPAIVPTNIQLNNLKWETISSIDIGLELNLFDNRFYIETDIYRKLTSDILFSNYNVPFTSGFSQLQYFNGGEMENKGWELMMNYKVIRTNNWMVSVNFNSSQNINAFTKLPNNFNTEKSTDIGNGVYPLRVIEGQPIGSFFGFRYLGVYASDADAVAKDANGNTLYDSNNRPIPMTSKDTYIFRGGDSKYEDINHDGNIDLNDVVYIGDSNPTLTGGFGTTVKYKNFDLSLAFYYRVGFDIINMIALQSEGMNGRENQSKAVLRRWRAQGQNEPDMLPRAYMDNPANNLGSDRYVEKGDFLRLNNIKIGYRLNQDLCHKLKLQSLNFSVSVRKLFTLTKYSGQDPEVGQNAINPFWIGIDNANTPPPKMVTLSVAIGF